MMSVARREQYRYIGGKGEILPFAFYIGKEYV